MAQQHHHTYRNDLADWYCTTCDTVTDYCTYTNPVDDDPQYLHDDTCCTFLGQHHTHDLHADLYYCDQAGNPTLIARYSDEPSDYQSGLVLADHIPELGEARTRAHNLGLLPHV